MRYGTLTDSRVFFAASEGASIYACPSADGTYAIFRYYEITHPEDREPVAQVLAGESVSAIRDSQFYDRKQGTIECRSEPGHGAEFRIRLKKLN